MLISLIDELLQRLLAYVAGLLLRAVGGPDHLPRRNEDLVWF